MADTWACVDAASADTLPAFPFNTFNFLQRLAGVSEAGPGVFAPGPLPRVCLGTSQTLLEH